MRNSLKIVAATLTLLAAAALPIASASAGSMGLKASCESGMLTPNGLWDCR